MAPQDRATLLAQVEHELDTDPQRVIPVLQVLVGRPPDAADRLRPVADALNADRRRSALKEFIEGALTTAGVTERLASISTVQGVHKLGATGRLLRHKVGQQSYWPAWQFDGDRVRSDLPLLLDALRGYVGDDAVAADRVMRLPREELSGQTLVEALAGADRQQTATAWAIVDTLGGGF